MPEAAVLLVAVPRTDTEASAARITPPLRAAELNAYSPVTLSYARAAEVHSRTPPSFPATLA